MPSVIVVDDDIDTVEVFSEFLQLRGIDVVATANNGLDGFKLYAEKQPDIVFSDIWMPDYDGFYLLKTIKENYPNSKVIMLTADLTKETNEKLKKLNVDSVIFKPFNTEDIINTLSKVLTEKKQTIIESV